MQSRAPVRGPVLSLAHPGATGLLPAIPWPPSQPRRANRLRERHLDLAALGVLVLLDLDDDRDAVEDGDANTVDGDGVVLGVEIDVLLESDEAFEAESVQVSIRWNAMNLIDGEG